MERFLTGIQSSGTPHLGNVLGAILPAIEASRLTAGQCLYFIADLHSLTSLYDPKLRKAHTLSIAATWLACGLDTERHLLYRQSKVPQVCELSWHLNCCTPYPMLANAHVFKEHKKCLSAVNAGMFTYPVLMAADILLYQAHWVPVGQDQRQHLEITRDIAAAFNQRYGDVFRLPQAVLATSENPIIPGTDGKKMSKSEGNTLDIFLPEAQLKKQIMRIRTDTRPMEAPKDPESCLIFNLYARLADTKQLNVLRQRYLAGGYGYGAAKQALFELILAYFADYRAKYFYYIQQPEEIERHLLVSEQKARSIAAETLEKVRLLAGT